MLYMLARHMHQLVAVPHQRTNRTYREIARLSVESSDGTLHILYEAFLRCTTSFLDGLKTSSCYNNAGICL